MEFDRQRHLHRDLCADPRSQGRVAAFLGHQFLLRTVAQRVRAHGDARRQLSANFSSAHGTKTPANAAVFVSVGNPTASTIQGPVDITLYLASGPYFLASTRIANVTRSMRLPAGRSRTVRIPIRKLPALMPNPYTLMVMVQATDGTVTSNVGPTINLE